MTTCTADNLSVCGIVLRFTQNSDLAQALGVLLGTPVRLLVIVIAAVLIRRALHRVIDRLADRLAQVPAGGDAGVPGGNSGASGGNASMSGADAGTPGGNASAGVAGPARVGVVLTARRRARARTLSSVLRSVTTAVIFVVSALMVLQELGYSVAPLLASAGVVGVAVGFGAQTLVRDVVSGLFLIAEDQYGVGDVVDLGEASGTVEAVGLRITRLHSDDGIVWYVRNGEILRVGNRSQAAPRPLTPQADTAPERGTREQGNTNGH